MEIYQSFQIPKIIQMNKDLIDYLVSNSGKLKEGESWYDIACKFDIPSPNPQKAEKDEAYKKKSMATKANDIWRKYKKQIDKLELKRQVYKNGELAFETFGKKGTPDILPIDLGKYEIEKVTTNPQGGSWLKYKKLPEKLNTKEHNQSLLELLKKEISPVEYNPQNPDILNHKSLFLYTSDKHIGALTKENSVYKNQYDRLEIKKRLVSFLLQEVRKQVDLHGFFDSIYVMDLGDALDGFNQKTTGGLRGTSSHTLPQQMNNREQHDFYVEVHKELFDKLVDKAYSKNIFFIATSNSNHGGDFEYGAMRNLETYLNVKYPFIKTKVNYHPINHFTYGKHCIIFGHGKDDEDMKSGFPLNVDNKVENYINDYINKNELGKFNITVVTGDLHQSSLNYGKNFRYRKVLSQYGSTKWMHTNFGSGSPGISYDVINRFTNDICQIDKFFEIENESNTGIEWNQ